MVLVCPDFGPFCPPIVEFVGSTDKLWHNFFKFKENSTNEGLFLTR